MMDKILYTGIELNEFLDQIRGIVKEEISKSSPNQEPKKDLIGVEEAASFLGLSKGTIYRLTSTRGIPFMKKNNTCWFSKKELESWVRAGKKISVESL